MTEEIKAKFDKIGAWTGQSAIFHPDLIIKTIKKAGINHIDIMLNDATGKNKKFHLFDDVKDVKESIKKIQNESGATVSVTSWVVPTQEWLDGMKNILVPLILELDIEELCLDIEEPWIIPLSKKTKEEIQHWSDLLKEALSGYKGRISGSCIVYTNMEVVSPILEWCDVIIPQSYATVGNTAKLKAGALERLAYQKFSRFNKKIILGAAAWKLEGAYGLHADAALRASLNAILELDVYQVRFWSLGWFNDSISKIVKEYL